MLFFVSNSNLKRVSFIVAKRNSFGTVSFFLISFVRYIESILPNYYKVHSEHMQLFQVYVTIPYLLDQEVFKIHIVLHCIYADRKFFLFRSWFVGFRGSK